MPGTLILKVKLREHLELRAWTAAELARKSGVPKQVLSLWLTGVEPRKLQHLKSVADVLGVSVDELCFGGGDGGWIEGVFEGRIRVTQGSVRILEEKKWSE